jgi:hypothetical protein
VNLVPHVKQDMYSVDGCSFNVRGTVIVIEQSEARCLKCSLIRDTRVWIDTVLMRLKDAGTFRNCSRIELYFKHFKKRNIQVCETFR